MPEERFEALFRASQAAIVQADEHGRVVDWNPAATEVFGYEREEILGESLTELMPERHRDKHREGLKRFLRTGEANVVGKTVELHGLREDGTEFPIELTIDTWTVDGERFFSGIIRDVTERTFTEKRLQQSLQTWEEFGYGISHDLQEPLRSILGHLQLVQRRLGEDADEEVRESIRHAERGTQRLSQLVEGLLDYARVETRGKALEPVDLRQVVEDVREDLDHLLEEHDARIDVDEPLPNVQGDGAQLRQLLQNLFENAVKNSGDEPPRIHVSASTNGAGEVELRVTDEGVGIDPDDQDDIFRMSYQADPGATGSGIGLALCRRIADRHGGSIEVDSTPGEGTTFKITLPAEGVEFPREELQ